MKPGGTRRGGPITMNERNPLLAPLATVMATDTLAHPRGGPPPMATQGPLTSDRGKQHGKSVCHDLYKFLILPAMEQ